MVGPPAAPAAEKEGELRPGGGLSTGPKGTAVREQARSGRAWQGEILSFWDRAVSSSVRACEQRGRGEAGESSWQGAVWLFLS